MPVIEACHYTVKCDKCGYNFDGEWFETRPALFATIAKAGWQVKAGKCLCDQCVMDKADNKGETKS